MVDQCRRVVSCYKMSHTFPNDNCILHAWTVSFEKVEKIQATYLVSDILILYQFIASVALDFILTVIKYTFHSNDIVYLLNAYKLVSNLIFMNYNFCFRS